MSEAVRVEAATPADEDAVMALCRLLHEENGIFELDEGCVREVIRKATLKDRAILGVVRAHGAVVGCVCLTIDRFWYTTQEVLNELFNFVHPDHRQSDYAKALIAFSKRCSDELRDQHLPLFIGVLSNHRTEAKVRLYRRQLQPAGAFFIHNMDLIALPDGA